MRRDGPSATPPASSRASAPTPPAIQAAANGSSMAAWSAWMTARSISARANATCADAARNTASTRACSPEHSARRHSSMAAASRCVSQARSSELTGSLLGIARWSVIQTAAARRLGLLRVPPSGVERQPVRHQVPDQPAVTGRTANGLRPGLGPGQAQQRCLAARLGRQPGEQPGNVRRRRRAGDEQVIGPQPTQLPPRAQLYAPTHRIGNEPRLRVPQPVGEQHAGRVLGRRGEGGTRLDGVDDRELVGVAMLGDATGEREGAEPLPVERSHPVTQRIPDQPQRRRCHRSPDGRCGEQPCLALTGSGGCRPGGSANVGVVRTGLHLYLPKLCRPDLR